MKLNRVLLTGLLAAVSSYATAAADPALLKARQKFFGIENVDANTGAVDDQALHSQGHVPTFGDSAARVEWFSVRSVPRHIMLR